MTDYATLMELNATPGLPLEGSEEWQWHHRRYYRIADITIQVDSDLPILETTFDPKFKLFEAHGPGEDTVSLRHHFALPDLNRHDLGREVYRRPPWAIYRREDGWVYLGIAPTADDPSLHRVVLFNSDHSRAVIFNFGEQLFRHGNMHSLTFFPTDQVWIGRLLADRQGFYLHSSGVILEGQGLLFVGHSEAGKSTAARLFAAYAEILCDDRNIVRRSVDGWRVYGTWSHGEVPSVSCNDAPLRAVLFLERAAENGLVALDDRREIVRRLLGCVIRPLVTADWWNETLALVERLARETPCYVMRFDRSGAIVGVLRRTLIGPA
jgi:hypothetical protein